MPPPNAEPAPWLKGRLNENPDEWSGRVLAAIISPPPDITSACEAYVVLLINPAGKYVRRVYLSLHSATAAVQRAQDKGQQCALVLCRLVPVAADFELASRWHRDTRHCPRVSRRLLHLLRQSRRESPARARLQTHY